MHIPPHIRLKVQTNLNPWRSSGADGDPTFDSMGSKSEAPQPLCVHHKGRVRRLRIASRQSCPSGVAFWEEVGGSSTSGGSKQEQQQGPPGAGEQHQRRQQAARTSKGAAPAAAAATAHHTPQTPQQRQQEGWGGGGRIGENATPEGQL